MGGVVETWGTYKTVYAAVEPLNGKEYFDSERRAADVNTRIRIRYVAGVVPKMRVLFGSRVFDIKSVINPSERNRELVLMCVEHV